jgi:hypothetical protein
MSKFKVLMKEKIRQAGGKDNIDKILPKNVKGEGVWLTKGASVSENPPKPGQGKGNQVSLPMSAEKEQMVRSLVK